MKRTALTTLIVVLLLAATAAVVWADKPVAYDAEGNELAWEHSAGTDNCDRIQDGTLTYPAGRYLAGEPVQVGFDIFGYNYQAHIFKGYFANVYLNGDGLPPYDGDADAYLNDHPEAASMWYWPYRDIELVMKWSDQWLANTDCNGDGQLDRHWGSTSYIGSGAWCTNHEKATNEASDPYTWFAKFVAKPSAEFDCAEIGGWEIWGSFCVIQEVLSGEGAYTLATPAGFGAYK